MVDRTTLDDEHTINVMLDCFGALGQRHLGHGVIDALAVLDDGRGRRRHPTLRHRCLEGVELFTGHGGEQYGLPAGCARIRPYLDRIRRPQEFWIPSDDSRPVPVGPRWESMVKKLFGVALSSILMVVGSTLGPIGLSPASAVVSTATVITSPDVGTLSNTLAGVSCVSSRWCAAVGHVNSGSFLQTLAMIWDGTAWSTVPSPGSTTGDSALESVSCVSPSWCAAVGYADAGAGPRTLTLLWDGSTWSGVIPDLGSAASGLNSVSCVSTTACVAVGTIDGGGRPRTLTMTWDGALWDRISSPNASTGTNVLYSTSCVNPTWCTAVGVYSNGVTSQGLVMVWNGSSWTVDSSLAAPTTFVSLASVSCLTTSMCVAVGEHSPGSMQPLVTLWDGTTWTIEADPEPTTSLTAVACVLPDACTFVGHHDSGSLALPADQRSSVLTWDGLFWNRVTTPEVGSGGNTLAAVSCTSTYFCIAVGSSAADTITRTLTLSLSAPDPSLPLLGGPTEPVPPSFTG